MGWVIFIGFIAMVGFIIWLAVKSVAKDTAAGVIGRFNDLLITNTHLIVGGRNSTKRYPLGGVRAIVEDAGQLSKRITATRVLATGVVALAWRKRQDDRSVFLTVEGPGVAVVREIAVKGNPQAPAQARAFAARLNAAAAALGPTDAGRPAVVVSADLGGQLRELAALRDSGALSEAEFTAAKEKLLGG